MDRNTNLTAIPWTDFEYLIRELFSKVFSNDGAEVRVTQASRDGGVMLLILARYVEENTLLRRKDIIK